MFGHTIRLNFRQKGDSHNTIIGGIFSIIVKLALVLYVALNVKKMLMHEDDKYLTETGVFDRG